MPYFENESLKAEFGECLKLGVKMLDQAILNQVMLKFNFTI